MCQLSAFCVRLCRVKVGTVSFLCPVSPVSNRAWVCVHVRVPVCEGRVRFLHSKPPRLLMAVVITAAWMNE
jgi:hypothetical protein